MQEKRPWFRRAAEGMALARGFELHDIIANILSSMHANLHVPLLGCPVDYLLTALHKTLDNREMQV